MASSTERSTIGATWGGERWAGVPAVAKASALDELANDDECRSEEDEEADDRSEILSAAAEFAVAIHPTVRLLPDPARAGLDRGRDALASDGTVKAEVIQQRA
jgi:hypothetical protein